MIKSTGKLSQNARTPEIHCSLFRTRTFLFPRINPPQNWHLQEGGKALENWRKGHRLCFVFLPTLRFSFSLRSFSRTAVSSFLGAEVGCAPPPPLPARWESAGSAERQACALSLSLSLAEPDSRFIAPGSPRPALRATA